MHHVSCRTKLQCLCFVALLGTNRVAGRGAHAITWGVEEAPHLGSILTHTFGKVVAHYSILFSVVPERAF